MLTTAMPRKKQEEEKELAFFTKRFRELRKQSGLTQSALAERSGLNQGTIQQFEAGRRVPGFDTLVQLANGLGVSLSAFDPPAEEPKAKRKKKGTE